MNGPTDEEAYELLTMGMLTGIHALCQLMLGGNVTADTTTLKRLSNRTLDSLSGLTGMAPEEIAILTETMRRRVEQALDGSDNNSNKEKS